MDIRLQLLLLIEATIACGTCLYLTTINISIGYALRMEQALFVIVFSTGFAKALLKAVDAAKRWITKIHEY